MSGDRVKDFLVPDLGEGLQDATMVSWHVHVGDAVELNQPLCTLETAKAQVEIPSPFAGRVVEVHGAEGDTLDVGSLLLRIDTDEHQQVFREIQSRVRGERQAGPVSIQPETLYRMLVRCQLEQPEPDPQADGLLDAVGRLLEIPRPRRRELERETADRA